ncbi:LOW QUALITY PROTEIN: DUF1637 domain-containing protein, partial [Cephalotus follicularis]
MTMEAGLMHRRRETVSHVNKVSYANKIIKKKKCKGPKKPAAPKVPTTLQELFDSCRNMFKGQAGTVPLPSDVQKLCSILDKMKPADVGLSEELQFFKPKTAVKGAPRVTYTTIYQSDNFSLCIFFLPAKAVIPLHNHPGMTVFSKLLLGKMHIKSYDWVNPPANSDNSTPSSKLRLARLKANSIFTSPCKTNVLYPTAGGNIHEFTAITPAVLDVIGPPYSKDDGRDCSYYKDFPYITSSTGETPMTTEEGNCYGWLKEIDTPENSKMDGIEYLGPKVIET